MMTWAVLLLAAGSLAIPAPSILLERPYPSSHVDPIHITCVAPDSFPGANFTLYRRGQVIQCLQAPPDQCRVTFNVSGSPGGKAAEDMFYCQYSVMGENSLPQLSDLSLPMHVTFPGSRAGRGFWINKREDRMMLPLGSSPQGDLGVTFQQHFPTARVPIWILALSLSLAGAFLVALGTAAMVIRKVKARNLQKKREQESCWAQMNIATTDMSFDNSLFAISTKMTIEDDAATLEAHPGSAAAPDSSGPRKRPTSTSSFSEPPEFSTFRSCQ